MFRTQDLMFSVGPEWCILTCALFTGTQTAANCQVSCGHSMRFSATGSTGSTCAASGYAQPMAPNAANGAAWTSPFCACVTMIPPVTNLDCFCVTLPAQGQAQLLNVTDPTCLCVTSREEGAQQALAHLKRQLQEHLDAVTEAETALAEKTNSK